MLTAKGDSDGAHSIFGRPKSLYHRHFAAFVP